MNAKILIALLAAVTIVGNTWANRLAIKNNARIYLEVNFNWADRDGGYHSNPSWHFLESGATYKARLGDDIPADISVSAPLLGSATSLDETITVKATQLHGRHAVLKVAAKPAPAGTDTLYSFEIKTNPKNGELEIVQLP